MQQIHEGKPLYVGVDTVAYDFGVSRAKAYAIIKDLNMELKKENPRAIVVAGKVYRIFYEEGAGIWRLVAEKMQGGGTIGGISRYMGWL